MQLLQQARKFSLRILEAKIFQPEKGQLSESIYDLFINKCHFIGLFS